MLFLYLAVLAAALYGVAKVLLPELAKPPLTKTETPSTPTEFFYPESSDERVRKLEMLLAEKNKNINLLQTELKIFHAQVHNFDKVKSLLEEEIHRLKEQNRIFRSELGLPTVQPEENTTRLFL